ncbi:hypothetical protein ALC62_09958, partial [Cyphomyrmex costatus]
FAAFNIILHRIYTLSLNTHEMKEDRWRRRRGGGGRKGDGAEGRDKRSGEGTKEGRKGGGGSREREESGKCTFFLVVGAHARAIVYLRVISLPKLFYPMEIRHPSECVCIGVMSYCYVCMCMYTRVNICVLRDNDFSGITL